MLTVVTSKGKLWEDVRVLTQAQKIFHSELRNQEPMTKMHNSPLPDLRLCVLLKSPWPFFPLPPRLLITKAWSFIKDPFICLADLSRVL